MVGLVLASVTRDAQVPADRLQLADVRGGVCRRGSGGAVEPDPHQRQRAAFAGQTSDDFHASAGVTKRALDEVGVPLPDPL